MLLAERATKLSMACVVARSIGDPQWVKTASRT